MKFILKTYFENINKKINNIRIKNCSEYTFRTDFENFLNVSKIENSINIVHEKKSIGFGKPDFVLEKNDFVLGYIEVKNIQKNISDKILNSEQIQRYLRFCNNFIISNYRDFILFRNEKIILKSSLFSLKDKKLKGKNIEETENLLKSFFSYKPELIRKPKKLSVILAYKTKILRELLNNLEEKRFKKEIYGLYNIFKTTLIEDLKYKDFIDTYAQTITYGLFLSRLNVDKKINRKTAFSEIPKSLGIIKDIFRILKADEIPKNISWIIDEIVESLNNIDIENLQKELSFSKKKNNEEDPYVYFYEHFLAEYDKTKRKSKGVYYTPIQVVKFIVKSINDILIKDFDKDFTSENVKVLDFAAGTGTFLLETFKETLKEFSSDTEKKLFIKNRLLKNFFAFEYLIAPYTIAHLKLSKYLEEEGHKFDNENIEDRLKIYLADTLDNTEHKDIFSFMNLSEEGHFANEIKVKEPVLIVMGNPPYNSKSQNNKNFILELLQEYKKNLNERKINLNDDYIKFIRYAQCKIDGYNSGDTKIESLKKGIIGIITNNSYLDGISHRQMRKSLLETFDEIYILNLHGNSIKGETDKNVFDIRVGVSIALFVKKQTKSNKIGKLFYFSTLDNNIFYRKDKFNFLEKNNLKSINWKKLKPKKPNYWFVERDLSLEKSYNKFWSLKEIFKMYSSGIQTKRDRITIHFSKKSLKELKNNFLKLSENELKEKYSLENGRDWSIKNAIEDLKTNDNIQKIDYRPFDFRFTFLSKKSKKFIAYPRYKIMKHFENKENIGLCFSRIWDLKKNYTGFFVTKFISDVHFSNGQTYVAPLYIYNEKFNKLDTVEEKSVNFTKEFQKYFYKKYKEYKKPEEILSYIYAVLNNPNYRKKYFEFLKSDFPKIPFVNDEKIFDKLSKIGKKLIDLHLLKTKLSIKDIIFEAKEDSFFIEKIKFCKNKLFINSTDHFEGISKEVFDFEIGSYKVIDKYLKSRKGLKLSFDEIQEIKKISKSIEKTIKIMKKLKKFDIF